MYFPKVLIHIIECIARMNKPKNIPINIDDPRSRTEKIRDCIRDRMKKNKEY